MFSEIVTLLKIVLVNSSTNAASERLFSVMRRIKTYLRSPMSQARLNSIMILHVHKERTDRLLQLLLTMNIENLFLENLSDRNIKSVMILTILLFLTYYT